MGALFCSTWQSWGLSSFLDLELNFLLNGYFNLFWQWLAILNICCSSRLRDFDCVWIPINLLAWSWWHFLCLTRLWCLLLKQECVYILLSELIFALGRASLEFVFYENFSWWSDLCFSLLAELSAIMDDFFLLELRCNFISLVQRIVCIVINWTSLLE